MATSGVLSDDELADLAERAAHRAEQPWSPWRMPVTWVLIVVSVAVSWAWVAQFH